MKFDINKLLELKLLRKIPKSIEKAKESIKVAESRIKEQKIIFKASLLNRAY